MNFGHRPLLNIVAIYSFVMAGLFLFDLIADIYLANTIYIIVDIVHLSITALVGLTFFVFSQLSLYTAVKYKNFLWIPTIALFFADIILAITAIIVMLRFNSFVKILNIRQQERGNVDINIGRGNRVVNVDCKVIDSREESVSQDELNVRLNKLNMLKDNGEIDEETYQNLRSELISKYIER